MDISIPVVIQDNQIEMIEPTKETNTYSFGRSTSTVTIHESETSVKKSKIGKAQKSCLMKQHVLLLSFKTPKISPTPGSESEGGTG